MSLKILYLVKICHLTHLQDENTKVKFMIRKLEKIHIGSYTGSGYGSELNEKKNQNPKKLFPDPQHWPKHLP
jgi:hypothetical protein